MRPPSPLRFLFAAKSQLGPEPTLWPYCGEVHAAPEELRCPKLGTRIPLPVELYNVLRRPPLPTYGDSLTTTDILKNAEGQGSKTTWALFRGPQ